MGAIRFLSKNGDDETLWNDKDSAKIAKEVFDGYISKGYAAFDKTGLIKKFNPDAETIIISKPLVGG